MKKIFSLITLSFLTISLLDAQILSSNQWRRARHELVFGAGSTNFLGDLGGANTIGSHSIKDINFKSSRFIFYGGYDYRLSERWSVGGTLAFGQLYGSDAFTKEEHRHSRDLHFRSPIIELSPLVHYYILTERYTKTTRVGQRGSGVTRPGIYMYTGVSGLWFNPKAKYTDGKWYALQPLGTEGQGWGVDTREKYKRITVAIPVGIGIQFPLNKTTSIGFEYAFRYTFSDYLDDCSTSYVGKSIFGDNDKARYFSDPTEGGWVGAGVNQQRGNSQNNDTYIFIAFTLKYKIQQKVYMPKF